MNQLKIIGKQNIAGISFTGIEGGFGKDKKALLVKEIADIHNKEVKHINLRINENRKRFKDGIDIIDLLNGPFGGLLKELGFSNRDIAISKNIYILSERGYSKLLKILEDDKAWEQYDKLVDGYFNMREQIPQTPLEILQGTINQLVIQEKRISQVELRVIETEKKQDNIVNILSLNPTEWRRKVNTMLNRIAQSLGGFKEYQNVRNESYQLLEERAKCNLSTRLTNKKKKMALEGVARSKINKVNKMDAIADDARLTEIYLAVVKELAIKHRVQLENIS